MKTIYARNVHSALPQGIRMLQSAGIPRRTRGGECITLPCPCTTVYRFPAERVVFWPRRDANPFFHFFEGLWMLAGRNDVKFLTQFVKRMSSYSDDGRTLHGAYGRRWKLGNQLDVLILLLKECPDTRRAVLTMWSKEKDLFSDEVGHKDVPCNTQIYFWRAQGEDDEKLHMTVTCRSNDIVWGAYGANAVHFSMLQEYMAAMIGTSVGRYWQVSNNYHAYTDVLNKVASIADEGFTQSPYGAGEVKPYPMVQVPELWGADLSIFFDGFMPVGYVNPFFPHVAIPLLQAHRAYKRGDYASAYENVEACHAEDLRLAAKQWLNRREENAGHKE